MRVSEELYDYIDDQNRDNETYDETLKRLLGKRVLTHPEEVRQIVNDELDELGVLSDSEADS